MRLQNVVSPVFCLVEKVYGSFGPRDQRCTNNGLIRFSQIGYNILLTLVRLTDIL